MYDLLLKLNCMHATGPQMVIMVSNSYIGSMDSDVLSEHVKLVSAHAKCMNTNSVQVLSIFVCPAELKDKVSGG